MPQRFPLRPKPLPDEWLGSWLVRLAIDNALSVDDLLSHLRLNAHLSQWGKRQYQRLEDATGYTQLEKYWTPHDGVPPSDITSAFLGVDTIALCPLCLKNDETPYIRREWLRKTVGACQKHGGPLRDHCPHCHRPIRLLTVPTIRLEPSHGRTDLDLRRCVHCQGDLALPVPQTLTRIRLVAPSTKTLMKPIREDLWYDMEDAMREVMFTFRLDTILGLDLMTYRSLGSMPKRITMEERMRMQNLVGFLLGDGTEPFKTVHARLSVQAAFILAPINQQAELPRERRWMYVAWLMTRIVEDSAEDVLLDWPRLAQCFVKRFESEVQPPPQHLSEDMEERLATLPASEQAPLRALMLGEITERNIRGKRGAHAKKLKDWYTTGHLQQRLFSLHTPYSKDDPLFKQDAFIEATRLLAPGLHRKLVLKLVGRRRQHKIKNS